MNIVIIGNIDSFQISRNIDLLNIGLRLEYGGNLGVATAELMYGDNRLSLATADSLSRFAKATKGFPPSQLAFMLQAQYGGDGFTESFATKGTLELSLLKSVLHAYRVFESRIHERRTGGRFQMVAG